jgi:hypothetical protein
MSGHVLLVDLTGYRLILRCDSSVNNISQQVLYRVENIVLFTETILTLYKMKNFSLTSPAGSLHVFDSAPANKFSKGIRLLP